MTLHEVTQECIRSLQKRAIWLGMALSLVLVTACGGAQPVTQATPMEAPTEAPVPTTVEQPMASATSETPAQEPTAASTEVPTEEVPTEEVPTEAPTATIATETEQPSTTLNYFWPQTLPLDLAIQPDQSSASDAGFILTVAQPGGGQFFAAITGGPESQAVQLPPALGSQPITVRGQEGVQFSTGAGVSLFWQEDGHSYAILGSLGLEDALTLAESLEPMDLAAWQARLAE
jgi:hypothetical protein